ncbi:MULTISPECIES: YeiH family putative sulfate export transporter [unclassified Enterobacter]|uniref:YeiH family putative sulfate export transporter n=1 Tax=unclassified Enterobacter TaxID=2608935 RepID=UPI0015C6C372|nr:MULTISPECIES: YeiH family putative sulfate export transporter [unclassified Enterobacter]MBB3304241.1 putative integral membrane protein (TIGR00698 family) [Enterobacter sp. Sphag1F]NYI12655.1 putative integral membrane protein (TIGR00698 family) [Enterobacter sp. Sphag71]
MAELSVNKSPFHLHHWLPGLLLTVAIAGLAAWLGNQSWLAGAGFGALTLAIILGIVLGNTLYPQIAGACDSGVLLAKQRLLRLGIILYGFRITVQQIADVGLSGVLIDAMVLSSTFLLTCFIGIRMLKMDRETVWLIGAGSSICGAAAVLASEPIVKAAPSKVAVAVATVVLFGTVGIVLYPLLWSLLPTISAEHFGIFTGSTLHEVAQVVAAGHAMGAETENTAVIAKMLRVMMLAPFLLILGSWLKRQRSHSAQQQSISFPWFALLFIVVALFNSLHLLPANVVSTLNQLANLLLAMAMAALGLTTRFSALKQAGLKPLLLGLVMFGWLIVGGGALNVLVQHFMA